MNHMDSKLYDAVITDNIDVLKELEDTISVRDQRTPTNSTVLHLACEYGSIKCLEEILCVHESLIIETNSRCETALHLAARRVHYEVVVALIHVAKSSLLPHLQNTSSTVVQNLIRKLNVDLETALHAAVRYNHYNVVQLLVKEDPKHPHPQNKYKETPLYLASIRCYTDIIRTALHAALLDNGGRECVKLLLNRNKDLIKVSDDYGWTAFHFVAYNNLYAIVEDLVGEDKSVAYLADKEHTRTPFHVAAFRGNVRVMRELVKYFPDSWEIVDGRGQNILHIAVEENRKEVILFIVNVLLQGSKASNSLFIQRDKDGNTPLHLIAKFGCYVPVLMDLRALDWEVLNNENLTPLDVLHSGKMGTIADQAMIERKLVKANVKKHWHLCPTQGPHLKTRNRRQVLDVETDNIDVLHNEKNNQKRVEEYQKVINTHMIVAALIATVALTAGFAMPGGFDGNEGPTQGSAILLRKTAFEAFMVTDTIALLFSISSLFLYFMTTAYKDAHRVGYLVITSAVLNVLSIIAMMIAFITGTYICCASSFISPQD